VTALGAAQAESYPTGPINLVIPLAAATPPTPPRARSPRSSRASSRSRSSRSTGPAPPGALGTDIVVKAPKDGHTILLTNNAGAGVPHRARSEDRHLRSVPRPDAARLAMRSPSILVANAEQPYHNFKELIDYAKKSTVSIGTAASARWPLLHQHALGVTKADLTMVPYTGATPALTAVRGNHIGAVILALGP
jgi:tripartite-type tricarboxylate transporter receptor subunit TctC